jgi:hypothetical protein
VQDVTPGETGPRVAIAANEEHTPLCGSYVQAGLHRRCRTSGLDHAGKRFATRLQSRWRELLAKPMVVEHCRCPKLASQNQAPRTPANDDDLVGARALEQGSH